MKTIELQEPDHSRKPKMVSLMTMTMRAKAARKLETNRVAMVREKRMMMLVKQRDWRWRKQRSQKDLSLMKQKENCSLSQELRE